MSLETYSVLLSAGLFLMAAAAAGALIGSLCLPSVRARLACVPYSVYLAGTGLVALGATVGAMVYQLAYLTPVCELCWWQRIFLFPVAIVAAVALWRRMRDAHLIIAALAAFGLAYALYHYYYHFQGLVLGNALALPCSSGGLLPACTESPILTFGFVTIPFMGVLVFGTMLALSFLAHRSANPND